MCILFWNSNNFTMKFKKSIHPICILFWNSNDFTIKFKKVYSNCILIWNSVYFFEFHDEIMSVICKDAHLHGFTSSPTSLEFKPSFNFDKFVWKGISCSWPG